MARDVVIPNAFIPGRQDASGQASPGFMNEAAKSIREVQIAAAGRDSYIPVIYGGPVRTGGLLYLARVYQGKLLLVYIVCEGPIWGYNSAQMNDGGVPASVTVTGYTGSQTTVDPTLAAAIPGFAEVMAGTAYVVCLVPPGASQGFPRFTFEVYGLKVYDPRGGLDFEASAGNMQVNIPFVSACNFGAVDFAFEAWVNFESLTSLQSLIEYGRYTSGFLIRWTANTMQFYVNGSTTGTSFAYFNWIPTLATPYHIIVQRRGTGAEFYVNGAAIAPAVNLSGAATAINPGGAWSPFAALGTSLHTPAQRFDGVMRRVRLYANRSFTAAEALAHYNATYSSESGLFAKWSLNERSGTTAADGGPNALHGTLVNSPTWVTTFPLPDIGESLETAYSDNPALCLADFLADTSFGAKRTVDWSTVATAADYCDELCGSEKRALLALALPERRPLADWIDVLRSYVPCWVNDDGDTAQLVPDKARAVDHTFTATNIAANPPPRLFKRGVRDRPTVVQIGYTRTDVVPWATGYAEATTGSSVRRIARVDMPGIQRYSQARRFAIERLNHYSLEDLEIEFTAFENGLKVRPGDVGAVTDDIGVTAKEFRLLQATDRGFGRWSISGREYDPASYSSVVETAPSSPDTGLPDPRVVAAPTSLVITETVYLEKSIAADALKRGLIYQSRFDCVWTAPVHAYPVKYRLQFLDGAQVVYEGESLGAAFSSPAVQQGKGYTVKVFARNQLGFESEALVGSKTAQGKLLPPGDVPAITQAFEAGGEVILAWDAAIDIDIQFYEWRYGPVGGFSWATATVIDRVDAQRARFLGLPAGTWRFAVKAIDSVGNYSATEKTVDITITVDSDSFLQSRTFTSPTLTNMVSAPMIEGVWKPRWITSVASDQWGTVMPNPLSSGSSPVASYHASATSKFVGENWDLGEAITAVWTLVSNATALSGSFTSAIETSLDGSNWTLQPGTTFSGTARYVRPVLEALTTSTMLISAPPSISFAMQARTETGTVTTLASGGKLVQLSGTYASTKDLQATAINTSAQRSVTVDNILVHSQTGLQLQFDYNGAGDNWVLQEIGGTSRTIVAGDYLEYDVYIDPANPAASGYANGAIYAMFTDASDIAAATDADGYNAVLLATGFDALARGQWKSRKISLAAFVGKQVSRFAVYCPGDAASGTAKVLYRNIRFTDGAGTDRASVWSSGLTTLNTTWSLQLTANIRLGPSNAFLIYAFNGATQVAQDARYTYTGY